MGARQRSIHAHTVRVVQDACCQRRAAPGALHTPLHIHVGQDKGDAAFVAEGLDDALDALHALLDAGCRWQGLAAGG